MRSIVIFFVFFSVIGTALATDGMNLEGYGPIAQSMGGASYAYDNGNAAVINNPATLGLAQRHTNRIDLAVGLLGPDITASVPGGPSATSDKKAYFMPAFGWNRQTDNLTYGFGVFAQGGMGTKYAADSFLALNSGDDVHAEVTFGRALFPIRYQVNKNLSLGGSVDFIWAGMDLKMAAPGSLAPSLVRGGNLPLPALGGSDYLRVDFADTQPYTGEAKGYGYAGKVGFVYRINDRLSIGGVYHSETDVGDLESDSASISFGSSATGIEAAKLNGKVSVNDFQWPATYGAGFAAKLTDKVTLVGDIKRINWSDVLQEFSMTFKADGGGEIDFALPQNWKDQTVYMAGVELQATDKLALRFGINITENPIPEELVNPLFPAIVETHYTAGFGYQLTESQSISLSTVVAPKSEVTNADGITIEHGQLNAQLMYSYLF